MRVFALARGIHIPVDAGNGALDRRVFNGAEIDALRGENREIAVVQIDDLAGVGGERGNVGSGKIAAVAKPDHQRTSVTRNDDRIGIIGAENGKAVGSVHPAEGGGDRLDEIARITFGNQIDKHFRVRFRNEFTAFRKQFVFQFRIVFDDSVVNQRELAGVVQMRVRVPDGGYAVSCPAGVRNAASLLQLAVFLCLVLKIFHLPDRLDGQQFMISGQRKTGGVISAVFQTFQSVEQDFFRRFVSGIANDSAHVKTPLCKIYSRILYIQKRKNKMCF